MHANRILRWDGCINVRDLGGLLTRSGAKTRWGAVVRSDNPSKLTAAGWSALYAYGIRTIISLSTYGQTEDGLDRRLCPQDITSLHVDVEDITDADFVQKCVDTGLWCTPLYYSYALWKWPERHAAAIAAVARARPGGVLIHCQRGNDRTGIVTLLLLALAGVFPEEIAADYTLSPDPERDELLSQEHTSAHDVILATLAQLNMDEYLRSGGLSPVAMDAIRSRLL